MGRGSLAAFLVSSYFCDCYCLFSLKLFCNIVVVGGGVTALMVIGMIGAFMFILIQLVLLVDFAHAWNERWLGNYEESQSRVWFTGIMFYAFVLLLLFKQLTLV